MVSVRTFPLSFHVFMNEGFVVSLYHDKGFFIFLLLTSKERKKRLVRVCYNINDNRIYLVLQMLKKEALRVGTHYINDYLYTTASPIMLYSLVSSLKFSF